MSEIVQESHPGAANATQEPDEGDSPDAGAPQEGDQADVGDTVVESEKAGRNDKAEKADLEALLVREGDVAADYLERLLDLLDYDGDIDLDVEAGRAVVSIDGGSDLDTFVGTRGQVLEALQELTRLAVQQETGVRSRLMLDVAGWRAGRREELATEGRRAAEDVLASGETVRLRAMTPFERKVVHDAVARYQGVRSESEGEEPNRKVVVLFDRGDDAVSAAGAGNAEQATESENSSEG